MELKIREILDECSDNGNAKMDSNLLVKKLLGLFDVSERYLLVEWLNGNPMIDGAVYFDRKDDCLIHWSKLPKTEEFDITHTICKIRNAR